MKIYNKCELINAKESTSGAVKRVGRSDVYSSQFDLEAEEFVPLPKGEVKKKKEMVQLVTLADLGIDFCCLKRILTFDAKIRRMQNRMEGEQMSFPA